MNLIKKLAIIVVALGSMSIAQADPTIVTSEADFLSQVGNVQREGFEGFAALDCADGGSTISTDVLTVSSVPTNGGTSWLCVGDTIGHLPGPTEGINALVAGSNTGDSFIMDFTLAVPANAIYFELTDAVERGDAFISVGGLDDILVASKGSGGLNTVFFGIIFDQTFTDFSLINTGLWDGWGVDNMIFASASEPVTIDIKPGSDPNCFNADGHGVIPVAVLGSDTFDVTTIDQTTLLFGGLEVRVRGNKGPLCSLEDSNLDGFLDSVCKFEDNADYWTPGDGDATLTGKLYDGTEFAGTDSICIVP